VIVVGAEYLSIIAWNFVGSGIIFVASSMFQALGNTLPPLLTSVLRLVLTAVPIILLARLPGFELRWIWYVSVASIWLHMAANLLLRRELERRLPRTGPVLQGA
jgi:Na+-driven multidrug efflux pump